MRMKPPKGRQRGQARKERLFYGNQRSKWLQNQGFVMSYFELTMYGNQAELKDTCGDTMTLVYDADSRTVYVQ